MFKAIALGAMAGYASAAYSTFESHMERYEEYEPYHGVSIPEVGVNERYFAIGDTICLNGAGCSIYFYWAVEGDLRAGTRSKAYMAKESGSNWIMFNPHTVLELAGEAKGRL